MDVQRGAVVVEKHPQRSQHQAQVDHRNDVVDHHAEKELQPAVEQEAQALVQQEGHHHPADRIDDLEAPHHPQLDQRRHHPEQDDQDVADDDGRQRHDALAQAVEYAVAGHVQLQLQQHLEDRLGHRLAGLRVGAGDALAQRVGRIPARLVDRRDQRLVVVQQRIHEHDGEDHLQHVEDVEAAQREAGELPHEQAHRHGGEQHVDEVLDLRVAERRVDRVDDLGVDVLEDEEQVVQRRHVRVSRRRPSRQQQTRGQPCEQTPLAWSGDGRQHNDSHAVVSGLRPAPR